MMSVLTFRNPNLRACRLQIGHECEGIVGRYPCTRRLRLWSCKAQSPSTGCQPWSWTVWLAAG